MALFTRAGFDNVLKRIVETGGLSEAMMDDIKKIRDDFDEREGILSRYGESYDGEGENYEFTERAKETNEWETKYNELKTNYINRFFGGTQSETETTTIEDTATEEPTEEIITLDEMLGDE